MITQKIELELNYDPEKQTLLVIDFNFPNRETPIRLNCSKVKDIDGIKTAVEAWIHLRESSVKNSCKTENG